MKLTLDNLDKYQNIPFDDDFVKANFTLREDTTFGGIYKKYIAKTNRSYNNLELLKYKDAWYCKIFGQSVHIYSVKRFLILYLLLVGYADSDMFKTDYENA